MSFGSGWLAGLSCALALPVVVSLALMSKSRRPRPLPQPLDRKSRSGSQRTGTWGGLTYLRRTPRPGHL